MFLKISQNSQENTCARVSLLKKLKKKFLFKKRLWYSCFPVNFAKFLRHLFYRTYPVAFLTLENKHLFYRTRPVGFSTLENKKQFLNQNQIKTITNSINETSFLLSVAFVHHFVSQKKSTTEPQTMWEKSQSL